MPRRIFQNPPKGQCLLVLLFLTAMLVPNVVLLITERLPFATALCSLLIPAGFYMLWCAVSRRPSVMILCSLPLMVINAFQLVISYLFGNSIIAVDMFLNVFTTSVSEAGELLGRIYPSVIAVIVIYLPLLITAAVSVRRRRVIQLTDRKKLALGGVSFMAIGLLLTLLIPGKGVLKNEIYPVSVFHNMKLAHKAWAMQKNYPDTSYDFTFEVSKGSFEGPRQIYVYVIGEASRASSWSLYGYERETNTRLSQRDDLFVFKDMLTQSNTTHKSVPLMLAPVSADEATELYRVKSISMLFREAGFRTAFISNQPPNRSMVDHFATQADIMIRLNPDQTLGQPYDEQLLDQMQNVIDRCDDDLFIILHTYGSHADHSKRYPRQFAHFIPDNAPRVAVKYRSSLINAYDNSVLYTDHLLAEVISRLEGVDAATGVVFCSDHGEDILDDARKRFLHSSPRTSYYQLHVPSFIWLSDIYKDFRPGKSERIDSNSSMPLSTANLFHTIADIAGLDSPYIDKRRSVADPGFGVEPRRYLNDRSHSVSILDSGIGPEDVDLFREHHIDLRSLE